VPDPFPTTLIVRNPRENPKKCSILPLRRRPDLLILGFPPRDMPRLDNYVRLAAEGPALSPTDSACGLLLLDGSWHWAEVMNRSFLDVPPRSLRGFQTAYPRVSKQGTDPANGLASVEALFLAYYLLGRSTEGLLDHYRWAALFLERNQELLRSRQ
jgi:pre-rRNA-processing protein TSR3